MAILSGGNVGIGTTTPSLPLQVMAIGAAFPATSGATQSVGGGFRLGRSAGNAILDIGTNAGSGVWLQSTNNSDLSINYNLLLNPNGGNVGIGTTSPTNGKLEVAGNASFGLNEDLTPDGTGLIGQVLIDGNGYNGFIAMDGTAMYLGHNSSSRRLDLMTNETSRLAITGTGNVGIGITNPTHLIHLNGGAYCNGTGAWVSGSDSTYKRDISTMTQYGLKEIIKLRPVTYIHKKDVQNKTQIGFIAQEVKHIIPEVVDGQEGNMGIAYDRIVPVLVNAIKEQQKIIEEQQKTISSLESDNESVQKRMLRLEELISTEAKK